MTYASRRQLVYDTASKCRLRGGEYTAYDRSTPESSEQFYRGPAAAGDPVAQYNLGLVYESLFSPPRYKSAAEWYEKAAAQNNPDAKKNLAYLYEQGLGVSQDALMAINLLREAGGLTDDLVLRSELDAATNAAEAEIRQLTAGLEAQNAETVALKNALDDVNSDLITQQQALTSSRNQLIALADQLAETERSNDTNLQGEVDELNSRMADNERLVSEKELAIATLEADVTAYKAQLDASERKAELKERQLQEQLAEAEHRADDANQQATTSIQERDAEIAKLNTQLISLTTSLSSEQADQQSMIAELDAARSRMTSQQSAEITRLVEEVTTREATIAVQLEQIHSLEQAQSDAATQATASTDRQAVELNRLNTELGTLRIELAAQVQAYDQLQAELRNSRTKLAEGEAATDEVDRLIEELNRRGDLITAQTEQVDSLKGQLDTAGAAIDTLQAKSEQQISERDYLEAQLVSVEARLVSAQTSLAQLENALSSETAAREALVNDIGKLEQQLKLTSNSSEDELGTLRQELSRRDDKLKTQDKRIATLERDLEQKQIELAEATSDRGQLLATRGLTRWPSAPDIADISIGNRYAVVIGNDNYENLRNLSTAVNGAEAVDRILRDRYGFETRLLVNARRQEILDAFSQLTPELTEDDYVLIYYAGHGEQDRRDQEVTYWLGVDARANEMALSADGINSYEISHNVKAMPAKHVMIIADSCYAGAMVRPPRVSTPKLDLDRRQLEYFVRKRSRTVLTSGGNSPVLDESIDGTHSVFTKALVELLEENPDIIYGEALHAMLVDLVRYNADQLDFAQEPRFSEIADAGHRNGQFVFKSIGAE